MNFQEDVMKRALTLVMIILSVMLVFSCASKSTGKKVLGAEGVTRPDWVRQLGKKEKGLHFEVGYGKMSNYATSLKKAEADARNKIAFWVQTDVNTVLKTYTQDAGIGEQRELIEYMEEISKQTAQVSISGAAIEDSWEDEDGGVYVLMSYDIEQAAENLANQMQSYQRNESAAFAEFKAQEAFRQLQYEQENR
jgi:hypothetical protein